MEFVSESGLTSASGCSDRHGATAFASDSDSSRKLPIEFINSVVRPQDRAIVVSFDTGPELISDLTADTG